MEPEGSLPHSQVPTTCPYPEPARSSPSPHILLPEDPSQFYPPHLHLGLPSGLFLLGFPTKTLYTPLLSPTCATCPAHLILLDFITQTIFGDEYRLSSSLSSFLHYPVTLPLVGPNILLNTLFSNKLNLHSSLIYVYSPYLPSWHAQGKLCLSMLVWHKDIWNTNTK